MLQTNIYSTEKRDFVKTEWQNLKPGDIIKVSCDESLPADLLTL